MNEGVGWQDAPVILLLWVANYACLFAIAELWQPDSWVRSKPGPPRALEAAAGVVFLAFFGLIFTLLILFIHQFFGLAFVLVPGLVLPLILAALWLWTPWERTSTFRSVRTCLVVLVLSLFAAAAWHATMGS